MLRTEVQCALLFILLSHFVCAQHEQAITASDRDHWSFTPLVAAVVPTAASQRAGGPIDAFIADKLNKLSLDIAPPAKPEHLLRRLSFDLTGLPPTKEDRERFAANAPLPDAYEREVDRLLASPACGEHLAQSWLDLARFAETDGFEHDRVRSDAWRYRNWVIGAINSDMPYDRFMRLQVAGDLMPGEPDGTLATTFCLAGPDMPDLNDQDERRHNLLNEMTGTVGSVLLGLQLGCAACHDHKYDPVSQADFYRLRGILATGVPELQRDRPWNQFKEQDTASEVRFYHRGDHRQPTLSLQPGVPRIAADEQTTRLVSTASHPRLSFVDWLASPANPLPARVMANRIWQSHMGRGLSATTSDFGLAGADPTHPELLDWLAMQLREQSWSVQWLRRQIVLSATYRSRSLEDASATSDHARRLQVDPDNTAYSRYPRRRLTGEMLRDAMLQVSGQLNHGAGGEGVMPPLPEELLQTLLPKQWKASPNPADHARRSVYVFARRNLRYPIFETFDRPDAGASCPVRGQSVTATQSLLMFNSEFTWTTASTLVKGVRFGSQRKTLDEIWTRCLGRLPTEDELDGVFKLRESFVDDTKWYECVAAALVNSSEFMFLD